MRRMTSPTQIIKAVRARELAIARSQAENLLMMRAVWSARLPGVEPGVLQPGQDKQEAPGLALQGASTNLNSVQGSPGGCYRKSDR